MAAPVPGLSVCVSVCVCVCVEGFIIKLQSCVSALNRCDRRHTHTAAAAAWWCLISLLYHDLRHYHRLGAGAGRVAAGVPGCGGGAEGAFSKQTSCLPAHPAGGQKSHGAGGRQRGGGLGLLQRSFFGKQFEHQRGGASHSRHNAGTESQAGRHKRT